MAHEFISSVPFILCHIHDRSIFYLSLSCFFLLKRADLTWTFLPSTFLLVLLNGGHWQQIWGEENIIWVCTPVPIVPASCYILLRLHIGQPYLLTARSSSPISSLATCNPLFFSGSLKLVHNKINPLITVFSKLETWFSSKILIDKNF